jgi:hypothetical protein
MDNHCWKYKNVGVNYEKFLSSKNVIPLLPEEGTKGRREKIN